MCGIFGWVVAERHRRDRAYLVRLTDVMSHRGPDGAGYSLINSADGRYQIGMGHRRLSIIDVEGGDQPMWSSDQCNIVAFNGEIYNYIELREQLVGLGHVFHTSSDTEVLVESYQEWGLQCLDRFRGMFAFALWDARLQRMIIARDPFGKKPIFLAEVPGGWLFGSEVEPLIQDPAADRTFNREALGHYLLNRYVPGPMTFFRGVTKLQPGSYAVWQNGSLAITRYYAPPFASVTPDVASFDTAVEMFKVTFDEAVRLRMRSDAPFGAYLSGGIDSSAIVATMTRHSSVPVRTFSVGFKEAAYSELHYARIISERFGTNHHEVLIDPEMFMANWSTAVLRRGAPVAEAADIPILVLSMLAAQTVKMVLTGEGADELMGGYPKYRAERWIAIYHRLVPGLMHDRLLAPVVRSLPYGMRRLKTLVTAAGERDLRKRMRVWFGGLSVAERDALLGRDAPAAPPDELPYSAHAGSQARRMLFFDQTTWLPDNLLERGDRMMMAGSIEGRMPFMDVELAALVARFPDSFLLNSSWGKLVLRTAMAGILPSEILQRPKIGFRVPFDRWFRGSYRDFLRDCLLSESSLVACMCDRTYVRALTEEHISGRANHEKPLWALVNLELFLRAFKLSDVEGAQANAA